VTTKTALPGPGPGPRQLSYRIPHVFIRRAPQHPATTSDIVIDCWSLGILFNDCRHCFLLTSDLERLFAVRSCIAHHHRGPTFTARLKTSTRSHATLHSLSMDFAYSPHREPGGTMHLPSPTHPHSYRMEGTHFSSIQQLRHSLSRSPSKPSRFHLRKSDSPNGSPISPLALARAFSPRHYKDTNTPPSYPESPLFHTPAPTTKKRFTLRRTAPFRSSPRNRPNSKSPRRVLAESTDQGNASPFSGRRPSGEENIAMRRISDEYLEAMGVDQKPAARFDIDDKPIKFEFARSRKDDASAPGANCMVPIKSSPLKRSDGVMNLDSASRSGSPIAKRRSLHGASAFGTTTTTTNFDVFEQASTPRSSVDEPRPVQENEIGNGFSFSSPISGAHTPLRKAASLRKSTLSQRQFTNTPRPKPMYDGEFALPMEAASKSRNRMSLDSTIGHSAGTAQSPFRKSGNFEPQRSQYQPFVRTNSGNTQPHPLSNALTQSPSMSGMPTPAFVAPAQPMAAPRHHNFSRSLPIGTTRPPQPEETLEFSDGSFATPAAYKMAKPNPAAFMSTGLLSKKNRNVDDLSSSTMGTYVMPDTPSKRMSFPPALTETPFAKRTSHFRNPSQPNHEFGTPSTPFSAHASKISSESFGKGVSIFGSFGGNHQRRSSFASIDGDDITNSPTANRMTGMTDSQSSCDETPPTPTKQSDGSGRRSKESSLRRKTFRQRTSLGTDTFAAPETPSINIPSTSNVQNGKFSISLVASSTSNEGLSPLCDEPEFPAHDLSPSSMIRSSARNRVRLRSHRKGRPSPFRRRAARSTLHPIPLNSAKPSSPTVFGASSPRTPNESFYPPDPSNLSISGPRRGSLNFGTSTNSNSFPPATPTTPRDSSNYFGPAKPIVLGGLTKNDIDTSLTSRFESVEKMEKGGEFSLVYKVKNPVGARSFTSPSAVSQVCIVKKSKKPFFGATDRAKQMREVEILQHLRGNEHIVSLFDHWEFNNHLYMQMEYCESGDLFTFLAKEGNSSRLDDFRIWKIMLDMALVSCFSQRS
jgi:mitosis inhibitor protein kinase SWE1